MIGFSADALCARHQTGSGHPESPTRFSAVVTAIERDAIITRLTPIEARDATLDELRRCHSSAYVDLVRREIKAGNPLLSTGDTVISGHSWEVALRAAGSALSAVDAVCSGRIANAFCVVRPPGHHATATRGMGFCIFNNVALAARHAQQQHGIGRVLIVDWDVHHGNGTQDIFYGDETVFYFSTHQSPWYPGTGGAHERGAGPGLGTTLNCPFPAGSGRAEIFAACEKQLRPAMAQFQPELVLISAGFDSRRDDPLGQFTLEDDDFADLTRMIMAIARERAAGKVVSLLEGGYNLSGLASAALAHVRALAS